ncbi:MAG TPA: hypothetical protein VJN92_24050 [Candidatus Acidoferrum sp.]|nr:hypothetical protein [Candidatus Acidoferrum sp.]
MNHLRVRSFFVVTPILAVVLGGTLALRAQEPPQEPIKEPVPQAPEQLRHRADGERHGMPLETFAVTPGTKFLVGLQDALSSKGTQENAVFKVKTLEPLEAGSGIYLPSGAEIIGHISRAEPAGVAGRAKLWLTFDEIHTKFGDLPIVAEVASIPGDHSVKPVPDKEGLIQGRTSTQQDAAAAAAAGAAIGAVKGVKDKDKKEAAEGAALGAITAYLMESGRGHELNLPKGAKLELELERALYLVKE